MPPPHYVQPNHLQLPPGFPWWQPPQQFQQQQQAPKITLTLFWHSDPAVWFTGGGTFIRLNVHHGHLRFDFALSALPENALTQLGDILRQLTHWLTHMKL